MRERLREQGRAREGGEGGTGNPSRGVTGGGAADVKGKFEEWNRQEEQVRIRSGGIRPSSQTDKHRTYTKSRKRNPDL